MKREKLKMKLICSVYEKSRFKVVIVKGKMGDNLFYNFINHSD